MQDIALGLLFILASIAAKTVIPSLPTPFAFLPLLFILGVLVTNRVSVIHGALWLFLSGIVTYNAGTATGELTAYFASAVATILLAERVFAKRSVYALLGLGLTTGCVYIMMLWIARGIAVLVGRAGAYSLTLSEGLWTLLLLCGGLYVGFVTVVTTRRWFSRVFFVR